MKTLSITEKITSFESACEFLGLEPVLPQVELANSEYMNLSALCLFKKDRESMLAYYKLTIIIRALNEDWEPDWSDWDQYKYYNWFYVDRTSAAFRFNDAYCTNTDTAVGSRLCFKNRDLAAYAAKQFEDLYKDYFLI